MENKTAAILVLAIAAAVIVTASGAYAMSRQTAVQGNTYPSVAFGSGMGPWGGSVGHQGGMMGDQGGHGMMMGSWSGQQSMQQYMWHYWNSTYSP
jgi:hypothetical protein